MCCVCVEVATLQTRASLLCCQSETKPHSAIVATAHYCCAVLMLLLSQRATRVACLSLGMHTHIHKLEEIKLSCRMCRCVRTAPLPIPPHANNLHTIRRDAAAVRDSRSSTKNHGVYGAVLHAQCVYADPLLNGFLKLYYNETICLACTRSQRKTSS